MSILALDIQNILVQYNITSLTYYLTGCENYYADWLSRSFINSNNDFSLSHKALACIIERLPFPLKVDMFASKFYFKLSHYVSRYFDPSAWKVDAFSFYCPNNIIYVFPPLSQILKAMNKIWSDEVEDIAIIFPCLKIFI